jgi:hypothetical protein
VQDIPPDIAVALAVVEALTATGRCREDAALYEPAKSVLRLYLEAAGFAPAPPSAPLTPALVSAPFPAPTPAPAMAFVPSAVAHPADLPPGPPPRADAIWHAAARVWIVPSAPRPA